MAFYIASLKHTTSGHEHIVFWGPNWNGYTPVIGDNVGTYDAETAEKLNDGLDCIAIPVDAVQALLVPEPYWKPGARFYDQRGPVVDNSRENWNALLKARLNSGRNEGVTPQPQTFQDGRRSFSQKSSSTSHATAGG